MDEVRLVGEIGHHVDDRQLYLAVVHDLPKWSPDLSAVRAPFSVFTALDVEPYDMNTLEEFGAKLIAAGCRDVSSWGLHADDIHLAVDNAFIRMVPKREWDDKFVGTTSAEEGFNEALDAALFTFGLEWEACVAITSARYAEQLERALRDPLQWHRDVFGHDVYIDP
jgi:hypothetical protein